MTNPINTTLIQDLYAISNATTSSNPFVNVFMPRDPTTADINYPIQKRWINTTAIREWMLMNFTTNTGQTLANWVQFAGTVAGAVTLTGNDGLAVPVDGLGNINVLGDLIDTRTQKTGANTLSVLVIEDPAKQINFLDDFVNLDTQIWDMSGFDVTNGTATNPGLINLLDPATGYLQYGTGVGVAAFVLGGGTFELHWIMNLASLSTVGNRYVIQIGLFNDVSGGAPTDGCFFEYSDNVNGGAWQIKTENASVTTTQNTNTAASTGFHNYSLIVNATASQVAFYIDGVQVMNSPLTTNIPTAALRPGITVTASSGVLPTMLVDAMYYTQILTTAR